MDYQLVKEEKTHFLIKHPEGHQITVAKAGMSPKVLAKIKAMPTLKMADGGIVPDESGVDGVSDTTGVPEAPPAPDPAPIVTTPEGGIMAPASAMPGLPPSPIAAPALPVQAAAQTPAAPARSPASAAAQPAVTDPDAMGLYNKAFAQQQAGLQAGAKAQADLGNANAKALADEMAQQKAQAALHQENLKQINANLDQAQFDYMNGKIDPNRVWNNASTGNKIMAGIGLILGGMGSALTGQPNAALGVIDKTIDQDIEAQKAEMSKKQNLFSMNLQKYHNENDAYAATKLDLLNATQAQLQMNAAKAMGPAAQAGLNMGLSQITMQKAQLSQQLAASRAQAQSLGLGGQGGGLPVGQEPFHLLSDPKYQKKRVVVNGKAYQASGEDGQEMRTQEALLGPILHSINELQQYGPLTTLSPTDRARVEQLRSNLAGGLASLKSSKVGSKRISDTEIDLAKHQIGDASKFSELMVNGIKNQGLIKDLIRESEAQRAANLIGYQGMNSISSAKPGIATRGR